MPSSLRVLAAAALSAALLAACGTSADSDDAASGGWSYTSGSGETITLDAKPERIIASAGEAAGLLEYGIKPVGIYLAQDLELEPGLTKFDLDGIEIIGEEWGKIDAEKAAALKPDLIVADWWPAQNAYQGFEEGVDKPSLKVAELAPVIGANQQGSLEAVVEWYEGFAESLGVDTESEDLAQDKAAFATAKADFQKAVAAKPGLSALALAPGTDTLYVAVPKYVTSLTDFADWGLDVVVPDSPKADFPYWEYLSWENADKYQADLLLIDDRGYEDQLKIAADHPTWTKIKAAKAGAITTWPGFWIHTYGDYAEALTTLTDAVNKADENLS